MPDDLSPRAGWDRLTRILHAIASVALVAMMLVVVADVGMRAVFNVPVQGAYDIVSLCLLVMVFFGIGPVLTYQREILIDLLDTLVPPRVLQAMIAVAALGSLAVFAFLAWAMVEPAFSAYRYGDRSLELGLPVWWQWVLAGVGMAGILLAAAVQVLRVLRGVPGKERAP